MLLILVLSVMLAVSSARTVNYAVNRNIGLVFDSETFTCTTAGIFPDPVDNARFYYCISDGNGFISAHIDCSPGYIFNAKSQGCVPKPRDEVSTVKPDSIGTLGPAITLTEIFPTKTPGTTETTPEGGTVTTTESTTITTTEGTTITTTEGTTITTTEGTTITTTEGTTVTSSTGPTESTTEAPFVCPGPGSFPDPFSKNHYYYCIPDNDEGFIPIQIACGTGSEYIPEIGTCGIPGETGTTTEHPGTGGTTLEPPPNVCTGEGLFPDPLDKSKFYYCLPDGEGGYIPIQLSCGQGMEFIPELGGCGIPDGTTTTESPQEFQCPGEGAFPNPDDVGSYYFCFADGEGGFIGVLLTCSTGQVFDPEAGQCVEIDQSTTESPEISTPAPFMCPDIGVFPDPTDKTKFYYCIKNPDGTGYRGTLFTCSLGQIFDEAKGYCSAPSDETPMNEKDLTTSNGITTGAETTEAITTEAPITVTVTTTNAETTEAVTTEAAFTVTVTTTNIETTNAATTEAPITVTVTTTNAETTEAATTEAPITMTVTTTNAETTEAATTEAPITVTVTTTTAETTEAATTEAPITVTVTTTNAETTEAATTEAPITVTVTTTNAETTEATMTEAPITVTVTATNTETTEGATTDAPITVTVTTTNADTTEAATTEAPITVTVTTTTAETTEAAITEAPITVTVTTTNAETTAAATTEPGCNTQPATTPITTTPDTTTNGSEESTVITSTTPAPFNCTADGLFPDPTDDTYFYFCMYDGFGYISITLQCSTGMVFIPKLARCAPPDTSIPPPAPVNCTSIGYLASPDNCQDYYYCYSNFKGGYLTIKHTCPNDTYWFEPMQICVDNVHFQCDKGISTTISTTTTTISSTAATTTTDQPINGFQCTQAGKFPYRDDDRKYYECKYKGYGEFKKKTKECPRWHTFSPYYQSCVRNWWFWW